MKIAVVEKNKGFSDAYKEYFNFDYDRFELTNSKKSKILKRDITLTETFEDYDYVVLVGKEPAKFIGQCTNVTKFAGHIVKDKFIPMLNPIAVKFNPGIKDTLDGALKKLHAHIDGSYTEVVGDYEGISCARRAKEWLRQALREAKDLVVDIETSSFYPREGYILGIALTYKTMQGVYIESDCIDEELEHLLQELFDKCNIIFHNAKFDVKWLQYHFNFKFPKFHDTMLQHYILNENEAHDLKFLTMKYTSMGEYDFELEQFKRAYMKAHGIKVADFSYDVIPFEVMYKYAAGDADATLRLYQKFNPIIQKHFKKLYETIMLRGTTFLTEMEEIGVPFDKQYLLDANEKMAAEIFELSEKLYDFNEIHELEKEKKEKFNPGSPAQLVVLFYEKLGLPTGRLTDGGAFSTDADELERLSELHPIANIILQIRQKTKLRSTYITKVLKGMDSDGRIRAGFHMHTVTSGRLSSSGKLNMQQLPRDDKTVKKCIRAKPGYVIFSQDLQTAEMYYAGALSGDQNLKKVFVSATGDFHSAIAKLTFNLTCSVEEVKTKYPELRQASKAISFGILYGAGAAKVAKTAGISFGEAQSIIKKYFGQFRQLKDWLDITRDEINSNGYIYSYFGRKRRVPNVFSLDDYEQGHALRSAMNFTVQSVASDINLLAAMDAQEEFKTKGINAEIFGLVHDSIIGQCKIEELEVTEKVLKLCTQKDRGVGFKDCPVGVDFGWGESYAEAA
jgi:DNA polymerase I-like protein with 3'-5' exonuclease and polymerase domains